MKKKSIQPFEVFKNSPRHMACLDEILQKYEQWEVWRGLNMETHDNQTVCILHGMVKYTFEGMEFKVESRDPETGEWGPLEYGYRGSLAQFVITGKGANAAFCGRSNALSIVRNFTNQITKKHFPYEPRRHFKGDWDNPSAEEIKERNDYHEGEILKGEQTDALRDFMSRKVLAQNHGSLTSSWLTFTKKVWQHIDRELLSCVLLSKYMKKLSFPDYENFLPYAKEVKEIKNVSKSLLPWLSSQHVSGWASAYEKIKKGERYYPETRTSEESTWLQSTNSGFVNTTTLEYGVVDWQDVKDVPFTVVHACMEMPEEKQAIFLNAWKSQPEEIKEQTLWLMPAIVHGFYASDHNRWEIKQIKNHLILPLLNVVLTLAAQEKREKGYRTVVRKEWRNEFFNHMTTIINSWAGAPPPNRILNQNEILAVIPDGSYKADYQKNILSQDVQSVATVTYAPPRRRL